MNIWADMEEPPKGHRVVQAAPFPGPEQAKMVFNMVTAVVDAPEPLFGAVVPALQVLALPEQLLLKRLLTEYPLPSWG